jgi:hypothetical protein
MVIVINATECSSSGKNLYQLWNVFEIQEI